MRLMQVKSENQSWRHGSNRALITMWSGGKRREKPPMSKGEKGHKGTVWQDETNEMMLY